MKRYGIIGLLACALGAASAAIALLLLSQFPAKDSHALFASLRRTQVEIVGFLPYWLIARAQESYNNQISTLAYFSLTIAPDGSILKLINQREEEPGWTWFRGETVKKRFELAKKANVKTALVVHTSNEDDIASLLLNPTLHADGLVEELVPLLTQYGIDEVNLDIESFVEATPTSRAAFITFISRVVYGLKERLPIRVSFDLVPNHLIKTHLTDPAIIGEIVDAVILMGYDYHYSASYLAGPVAPLGGAGKKWNYDVETAVKLAVAQIPNNKLILGIPLYGYQWQTLFHTPGSPVLPETGQTASNRRVETLLATCPNCQSGFDPLAQEPYVIYPDKDFYQQIYYENEEAIRQKIALTKKYNLAGIAIWALGYEGKTILAPFISYKQHAF